MTIGEAWDALDAAGAIAQAHGYRCAPVITRDRLLIHMDGKDRRTVTIQTAALEACPDAAARRALVEREVARLLKWTGATA